MSARWRVALAVGVGVLLGFFAALAAFQPATRVVIHRVAPADVGAATAQLNSIQSASYGAKQAAVHLALVRHAPVVPFIRTLDAGSHDQAGAGHGAVWYLQRALVRARVKPRPRVSGSFGAGTEAALKAFQRKHHIAASGVYGSVTHHALSPFYDLAGRRALQAVAHTRTQLAKYARINHGESYAWLHRTSMAYSQSASRAFLPLLPGFPRATDCSGYATWLYKISGLPDPSGFAYRVVGYTGTLAAHGVRVPASGALHPGDLVFYGGGWPYGHVAIVVNGFTRTVSSHGSPGIKVVPFNYRPVSAIRRYF